MRHLGMVQGDMDHDNLIDDNVGEPASGADETGTTRTLTGAPEDWMPPSCPVTFGGYKPKAGEPSEEELDNPAGWSMFTFMPSYNAKTKKYDCHTMPMEHVLLLQIVWAIDFSTDGNSTIRIGQGLLLIKKHIHGQEQNLVISSWIRGREASMQAC